MFEKPEAIMINVPVDFFVEKGESLKQVSSTKNIGNYGLGLRWFIRGYESMGTDHGWECFYHFISKCPVHQVTHAYICFGGYVKYKAIVVEYLKKSRLEDRGFDIVEPRDWVVLTGPVEKAPEDMVQKGFRGFRYTKHLF